MSREMPEYVKAGYATFTPIKPKKAT